MNFSRFSKGVGAFPLCLFTTFTASLEYFYRFAEKSAFPASLESLKREALKAFQCGASTVKAVMENSAMLAGDAFADILEVVWRFLYVEDGGFGFASF